MALTVQRKIAHDLQATEFLTIMTNECTDVVNQEQVSNNFHLHTGNLLNSSNNIICKDGMYTSLFYIGGIGFALG